MLPQQKQRTSMRQKNKMGSCSTFYIRDVSEVLFTSHQKTLVSQDPTRHLMFVV